MRWPGLIGSPRSRSQRINGTIFDQPGGKKHGGGLPACILLESSGFNGNGLTQAIAGDSEPDAAPLKVNNRGDTHK